ncbi:MAG: hypothetical protein NTU53_07600 [Planctomycetota bacterium]|nr:hypothetical protein [Planctomycetota bacterium]
MSSSCAQPVSTALSPTPLPGNPPPTFATIPPYAPTATPRAIALSILAKPRLTNFPALWQDQLLPRSIEIARPQNPAAFGLCRCLPGLTDRSFKYIALLQVIPTAPEGTKRARSYFPGPRAITCPTRHPQLSRPCPFPIQQTRPNPATSAPPNPHKIPPKPNR